MSQADLNVANQSGAAFRADLNTQLLALGTLQSGASEPGTTYAYMLWADSANGLLKQRNAANNGWVSLGSLVTTNLGMLPIAGGTMTGAFGVTAGTVSAPGVFFSGDTNTGVYSPNADTLALATAGTNRLHITSAGLVGLGTSSPAQLLHVSGSGTQAIRLENTLGTGNVNLELKLTGNTFTIGQNNTSIYFSDTAGREYLWNQGANERMRLDTSGRLGIGTTGPTSALTVNGSISTIEKQTAVIGVDIATTSGNGGDLTVKAGSGSGSGNSSGKLYLGYGRGNSSADSGFLAFGQAQATNINGLSSEAARIDSSGRLLVGTASYPGNGNEKLGISSSADGIWIDVTGFGGTGIGIDRTTTDGDLINFLQAGAQEGVISVSGTTVTYGGGHLARWSQLPNGEDPSGLLKGTVMSNLDEMCEWGEEDNEQLNKTKVSDVEGDPNVAGVFVSTSFSDDGLLDYFCAMTGDMIIRIAEGVTVQRGDLLMSAGDGTAKPQDDDIIHSKTVAKVTSTHVTCTYEDGSYCVPCVLMAC